jgi:hypothetical protein
VKLSSRQDGLTLPKNAPPAFHILAKPTGAICNLDCKYCFFLSKEILYPGSRFRMAEDLLETYLKQLLESHQDREVIVAWQGREPTLMGLEFFQRSVEYAEKYKRPDQRIQYTIQTNGTNRWRHGRRGSHPGAAHGLDDRAAGASAEHAEVRGDGHLLVHRRSAGRGEADGRGEWAAPGGSGGPPGGGWVGGGCGAVEVGGCRERDGRFGNPAP